MRTGYLLVLAGGVAAALTAAAIAAPRDVVLYNHSPSVPVGFYVRARAPVVVGAFVTVRALDVAPEEARRRNFTAVPDRFIKRVAAAAGERVCGDGQRVVVGAGVGAVVVTVLDADEQHHGAGERGGDDDGHDDGRGDAHRAARGGAGDDAHADDGHAALVGWRGCRILGADEVLLLGDTPDSFDGRYWGPINVRLIEGVWRRL